VLINKTAIFTILALCGITSCGGSSNSPSTTTVVSDDIPVSEEFVDVAGVWTVSSQGSEQPYTVIRGNGSGADYTYTQGCYKRVNFTISTAGQDNYLFNYANGSVVTIGMRPNNGNLALTTNGATGNLSPASVTESGIAPLCESVSNTEVSDTVNNGSFIVNAQNGALTTGSRGCSSQISQSRINTPTRLVNTGSLCDYRLDSLVTVTSDLSIDPGVGIRVYANGGFTIDGGRIIADGTAENPIVMDGSSHTPGHWWGVRIVEGGDSLFDHFHITDAGRQCVSRFCPSAALSSRNANISITNSSFSNSSVNGVDFDDGVIKAFSNNRFFSNGWAGIVIIPEATPALDPDSDYSGGAYPNGIPMPYITAGGHSQSQTYRWRKLSTPYYIGDELIHEQGQWLIDPGVEIVMNNMARISLSYGAYIEARGTAQEPITISGKVERPGYWGYISMRDTGTLVHLFEHIVIKDFGNTELITSKNSALNLDNASIALNEVTIKDGIGNGISCDFTRLNDSYVRLYSNVTATNITGTLVESDCSSF